MRKLAIFASLALVASALHVFAGCGSEDSSGAPADGDGGDANASTDGNGNGGDGQTNIPSDASINDNPVCKPVDGACTTSAECCSANCNGATGKCTTPINGMCKQAGTACTSPTECCQGSCVNGSCAAKQCVPDQPTAGACGQAGDCCSGICTTNKCASVNPGGSCRTAGNPCSNHGDCCSKLCNNGICSSAVSFCTQEGEICGSNSECCGGNCVKQGTNLTGLCGAPTSGGGVPAGCAPSGTVCGGSADAGILGDGGVLPCDQKCCSRSCGYFGATAGFRVCEPPSGCKPTGEVCRNDSDCCGWSGAPDPVKGPVMCSKASATAELGRCDNGGACREPGSICKPGDGDSCSAENNCCEHSTLPPNYCNNNPENCCNKDALGIPRCLIKPVDCTGTDGGTPPVMGSVCATSADCCGAPCVGNTCGAPGSCVPTSGACTTTADCCTGLPCILAPGSTKGVCGGTLQPDGGVVDGGSDNPANCALYGQICTTSGNCCNGVPCTSGRCRFP